MRIMLDTSVQQQQSAEPLWPAESGRNVGGWSALSMQEGVFFAAGKRICLPHSASTSRVFVPIMVSMSVASSSLLLASSYCLEGGDRSAECVVWPRAQFSP